MKLRTLLRTIALVLLANIASAQTASNTSRLSWEIIASSLIEVNLYTWKYYPNAAATGVVFPTPVTCAASTTANEFTCSVAFPAFTPGPHTLNVTATDITAGEGPKSATPFSFTFSVIPGAVRNLRLTVG